MTQDIDNIKFNTAISALMILSNEIAKAKKINHNEYKTLLTLLNPFAPHITEEMWTGCGFGESMKDAKWPEYDENKLVKNVVEIAVQVNSKIVARVNICPNDTQENILGFVKQQEAIKPLIEGKTIVKEISVPGRIVNRIVK